MSQFYQALFGAAVGLIAYIIYSNSMSVMNAVTIIFLGGLLFYGFRNWKVTWNTIKLLQNPQIIALIGIGLGFAYISYQGLSFWPSTYFSAGTALIGFAVGMVIYGLWNLR